MSDTTTTTPDEATEAEARDYVAELEAEGAVTAKLAGEFETLTVGLAVSMARADVLIREAAGTAGTVEVYAKTYCPDLADGLWTSSYAYKALMAGRVMLAGGELAVGPSIRALTRLHPSVSKSKDEAEGIAEVAAILKRAWGRSKRPPTEAKVIQAARDLFPARYPAPVVKDETEDEKPKDEDEKPKDAEEKQKAPGEDTPEAEDGLGPIPSGTARSAALQYVGVLGSRVAASVAVVFPEVPADVAARIAYVTLGDVVAAIRDYGLRAVAEAIEATEAAGAIRRVTAPTTEAAEAAPEAPEAEEVPEAEEEPSDADLAAIVAEAEAKAKAREAETVKPRKRTTRKRTTRKKTA